MSRKNVLYPYKMMDEVSLGASITGSPIRIEFLDNIAMQIIATNSNAVGTFSVEGSLDCKFSEGGVVVNSGTWTAITLSPVPTLASANATILLDLNQLSFPYIRLKYTRVSGTGTVTAYISGKAV